jgi:hypothetical protein
MIGINMSTGVSHTLEVRQPRIGQTTRLFYMSGTKRVQFLPTLVVNITVMGTMHILLS